MAKVDNYQLIQKINNLEGLSTDEKSKLIDLLNHSKPYGLVWEEKHESVEDRFVDELPVLEEVAERRIISENADSPNHIIIEGDNLHALTTLAYTHENSIDVIYIDPPYNTGNKDFVYNDSFVDREDSYRHSKWLSFMHKRLTIAKTLLSEKGVIFISIDDNEQANLKLLCDEIFGEENFVAQLILKTATDNNPSQINTEHEYMLCYSKKRIEQGNWERPSEGATKIINKYKELKGEGKEIPEIQKELRKWIRENKDVLKQVAHYNNVDEKGVYSSSSNSSNPHPGGYTYDIVHPITKKPCPKPANGWRWPFSTFKNYDEKGEVEWGKDDTTQPHIKKRIETSTEYLRTLIYEDNRATTKALAEIFEGEKVFNNPKPTNVLSRILDFASSPTSTILDFFAGSGTTLHAVMELNNDDGGNRKCILVTNNENNICENVTYERNKRVIKGYTDSKGQTKIGLINNNLRYYKTDFVGRERNNTNMRKLVESATDMLCIKNDIYEEQDTFFGNKHSKEILRFFDDGKKMMLIIYLEDAIEDLVEIIDNQDLGGKKIITYVFSPSNDPYTDDFFDVEDKVKLVALPSAIYNAYSKIWSKRRIERLKKIIDEIREEKKDNEVSEPQLSLDFENNNTDNQQ